MRTKITTKPLSINFNEGGRFTFCINYMTLAFYLAVVIPYPWWSKRYRKLNMDAYGSGWHFRHLNPRVIIRKRRKHA